MKIKLTYNNLTVTIEAKGLSGSVDAIMIGSAVLTKTTELECGKPKLEMDSEDLKE